MKKTWIVSVVDNEDGGDTHYGPYTKDVAEKIVDKLQQIMLTDRIDHCYNVFSRSLFCFKMQEVLSQYKKELFESE